MKANELRIGNWVQKREFLTESKFVEITVTSKDFAACIVQPKDYKRIRLTEEWLYRFGFERTKEGVFKLFKDNKTICTVQEWDFGKFEYSQLTIHGIYIYYVHHLQNLYFELTNQELTLI